MQSKPHRIKPPKFKVDQYVLNEYELRHLQVQVAKKEVPNEGLIVEQGGVRARFLPDGRSSPPKDLLAYGKQPKQNKP